VVLQQAAIRIQTGNGFPGRGAEPGLRQWWDGTAAPPRVATALGGVRQSAAVRVAQIGVVLCLLVGSVSAAQAQGSLSEALGAYRGGELDRAAELFEAALTAGGHGPEELAVIHLHRGILQGSMGDEAAARTSFEIALAVEPTLEAPGELSPTLSQVFEAARAERAGRGIALEMAEAQRASNTTDTVVRVRASNAPEGLVARIRVRATTSGGAAPWTEELMGADGAVRIPAAAWRTAWQLRVGLEALDGHGSILARAEFDLAAPAHPPAPAPPIDSRPAPEPPSDDDGGGGILASPWFWLVTGVLVAGAITAAVLVATTEDRYVVGAPEVRP